MHAFHPLFPFLTQASPSLSFPFLGSPRLYEYVALPSYSPSTFSHVAINTMLYLTKANAVRLGANDVPLTNQTWSFQNFDMEYSIKGEGDKNLIAYNVRMAVKTMEAFYEGRKEEEGLPGCEVIIQEGWYTQGIALLRKKGAVGEDVGECGVGDVLTAR